MVSLPPNTVLLTQLCLHKLWVVFIIGKVMFNKVCVLSVILPQQLLNSFGILVQSVDQGAA